MDKHESYFSTSFVFITNKTLSQACVNTTSSRCSFPIHLFLTLAGLTGLLQPVDLGVTKPLKDMLRRLHNNQRAIRIATHTEDSTCRIQRQDAIRNTQVAFEQIAGETIRNSFRVYLNPIPGNADQTGTIVPL
jgi:hypothetical protein